MDPRSGHTEFAPAERAAAATVESQARRVADADLLQQLYDAVNDIVLILNRHRQIVFCNRNMVDLLGLKDPWELLGLRPGEALGCVHAARTQGGCGTSEFCATCGAVQAILTSQRGAGDVQECRIARGPDGDSMDLRVRASPLTLEGELFTVFAVTDVSHEKRRRALERVFFHDVLNTAGIMRMMCEFLAGTAAPGAAGDAARGIRRGAEALVREISAQRDLMAAESNELTVLPVRIASRLLLQDVLDTYGHYAEEHGCRLVLADDCQDVEFRSDHAILNRVLGNMVKNAVEACEKGQVVTVGCRQAGQRVEFSVHNPATMPRAVQLQLFQRSFSTKGAGRGLGAYSMKLLTERYLKGSIGFTTSEESGTTFTANYGLDLPA